MGTQVLHCTWEMCTCSMHQCSLDDACSITLCVCVACVCGACVNGLRGYVCSVRLHLTCRYVSGLPLSIWMHVTSMQCHVTCTMQPWYQGLIKPHLFLCPCDKGVEYVIFLRLIYSIPCVWGVFKLVFSCSRCQFKLAIPNV